MGDGQCPEPNESSVEEDGLAEGELAGAGDGGVDAGVVLVGADAGFQHLGGERVAVGIMDRLTDLEVESS